MADEQHPHDEQSKADEPAPIESASATTSPDNKSGSTAYVLVGVVLVALVALGIAVSSAVTSIATSISSSGGSGTLGQNLSDDDLDELEDLLNDLEGDSNSGSGNSDSIDNPPSGLGYNTLSGSTELTEDTVMSYDYYCFDYTVGDFVYAADYAGAQEGVSAFVKSLVEADSSAASALRSHVRAAAQASDAETRASELEQAAQTCVDAQASLAAISAPAEADIAGSRAADIAEELAEAREDTIERWADLASIVEIMKSPSGHKASEIAELDEDAGNVTPIAMDLASALYDSANYK